MQQFSTWYPCVLPPNGPTWDPHETHVCLPSVLSMLGQFVITIMGPHMGCHYWGTLEYATIFRVGPMCVLPLKISIWDPHITHVCLQSAFLMLGPCALTFCEANVSCFQRGLVFCPSKHPLHRWSKWSAQLECNGKVLYHHLRFHVAYKCILPILHNYMG